MISYCLFWTLNRSSKYSVIRNWHNIITEDFHNEKSFNPLKFAAKLSSLKWYRSLLLMKVMVTGQSIKSLRMHDSRQKDKFAASKFLTFVYFNYF